MSRPATILNVDDTPARRSAHSGPRQQAGFSVREAITRTVNLQGLADRADVIVLDLDRPPRDGLLLCQRLTAGPSAPVLLLSTRFSGSEQRVRGLDSGASACLAKPVKPSELLAVIRAALRQARRMRPEPV